MVTDFSLHHPRLLSLRFALGAANNIEKENYDLLNGNKEISGHVVDHAIHSMVPMLGPHASMLAWGPGKRKKKKKKKNFPIPPICRYHVKKLSCYVVSWCRESVSGAEIELLSRASNSRKEPPRFTLVCL